jgi:hypothetical protein
MGLEVIGNYALVTANFVEPDFGELQIIDVSDPSNPSFLTSLYIPGGAYGIHVAGGYAYVCAFDYGLRIFDVSYPPEPSNAGYFNTRGSARHTFVDSNYAFVADGTSGVSAVDVTDPFVPAFADSIDTRGIASDIYAAADFIYVADDFSLTILHFSRTACNYAAGDINGNGFANGIDVTYGVSYFKGGEPPPTVCIDCPDSGRSLYGAGDVNGGCAFNGIDITYFIAYLKGSAPELLFCPNCPP